VKKLKIVGIIGLMLLVLGVVSATSGSGSSKVGSAQVPSSQVNFPDDGVSTGIEKALGRETSPANSQSASSDANPSLTRNLAIPAAQAPASAADAVRGSATGKATETGGATSAPADPSLGLVSTDDRKIVQTASVNLQVKDVGGVFQEVGQIASAAGGLVAGSNFALQGEQQIATTTIRVPASRYQDVLGQVRALGVKVEAETSNASDVTQEYSDLAARQRTLEATQAQLLQFLGQTKNISETLQVQDRLNSVQTQIEQAKGRIQLLDKLSDYATLTVHLRPVVVPAKTHGAGTDLGARVSEAWDHSLRFLGDIAGGVLEVVVFGWWLPLLAVPAIVVYNRTRRPAAKPAQAYD
jgi:uncharacterized protein DUF4349